ncbi:MAG: hypothetical protein MJK04_04345, partial [Psychrosphaera sp.]|nr:hypothetical protein [Psychrosphaera sp.]
MSFTELNSVEHYIVHKLTGVNLNDTANANIAEAKPLYGSQWQYRSPEQLGRGVNEVMIESEVKAALIRLNPDISNKPEL